MLSFSTLSASCSRARAHRSPRARMFAALLATTSCSLLASCGSDTEPESETEEPPTKDAGAGSKPKADAGDARVADARVADARVSDARATTPQPDSGASDTDASSGSSVPASFDTVKLVLSGGGGIMPCFAAPCHGANGAAPPDHPLELPLGNDQKLFTNLTTYVSKACDDTKLVTPGKPDESALVTILKGPCGETPRMPYDCSDEAGDCIPEEYIEAISKWIADGAKR